MGRTEGRDEGKTTRPKAHPDAWRRALELAGGNTRRLVKLRGGAVLVLRPGQRRP